MYSFQQQKDIIETVSMIPYTKKMVSLRFLMNSAVQLFQDNIQYSHHLSVAVKTS